ncbi:MAG: YbhB/YbcL family Raf kinase inhibitor-like protein [Halanaeroarchaeum sp.]
MRNRRRTVLGSIGAGVLPTAGRLGTPVTDGGFTISSSAFDDGDPISDRHTCSGADASPPLDFAGVPEQAAALGLVVDDPDAPGGTFTHWLLWNVPADRTAIPAAVEMEETLDTLGGARQGRNDFGSVGYRGPCPPEGDGPHTYRFRGFALESTLEVAPGATRETVLDALESHALASDALTGTYER